MQTGARVRVLLLLLLFYVFVARWACRDTAYGPRDGACDADERCLSVGRSNDGRSAGVSRRMAAQGSRGAWMVASS
eukprot:364973-Chlamydomonas_euryale.AAC.14